MSAVTCERCRRSVECVTTRDGTEYRPFAWRYPHDDRPLVGVCPDCDFDVSDVAPNLLIDMTDVSFAGLANLTNANARTVATDADVNILEELARQMKLTSARQLRAHGHNGVPIYLDPNVPLECVAKDADGKPMPDAARVPALCWKINGAICVHPDRWDQFVAVIRASGGIVKEKR